MTGRFHGWLMVLAALCPTAGSVAWSPQLPEDLCSWVREGTGFTQFVLHPAGARRGLEGGEERFIHFGKDEQEATITASKLADGAGCPTAC